MHAYNSYSLDIEEKTEHIMSKTLHRQILPMFRNPTALSKTVKTQTYAISTKRPSGHNFNADKLLHSLESMLESPAARQKLINSIQTYGPGRLEYVLRQDVLSRSKCIQRQPFETKIHPTVLKLIAIQHGLPFLGFGFVDNAVMILAGDYIDLTLGVALGISSIAAAGIGNIFADLAGLALGGIIEEVCARHGIHAPVLTQRQLSQKEARYAKAFGRSIGVTVGCILGMTPLFFIHTRKNPNANLENSLS